MKEERTRLGLWRERRAEAVEDALVGPADAPAAAAAAVAPALPTRPRAARGPRKICQTKMKCRLIEQAERQKRGTGRRGLDGAGLADGGGPIGAAADADVDAATPA